ISARTKAALAAAKARGVKLGGKRPNQRDVDPELGLAARVRASDEFARCVGPVIAGLRNSGLSLRQIVAELQKRGIRAVTGRRRRCGTCCAGFRIAAQAGAVSG